MAHRLILAHVRSDDIRHDPFGTAMAWLFSVADILTDYGPPTVPGEWQFRQAIGGSDVDAYAYEILSGLIEDGDVTTDDVLKVGQILHRYVDQLKRSGRD